MVCKKSVLVMVLGCVLLSQSLAVFGRGTPEDAWKDVDGKEYWRQEFDITEEEPGVHNIIIRSEDFAGNEFIEGPYNIHVDPDSDLPTAGTIYPERGQVVRSSVSVVGGFNR